MALALGKIVVANPENWLVSDNKLYVFGSPAPKGPELFEKDLAGNISQSEPEPADPSQGLSERLAPAGLFGREAGLAQPIAQALEIGGA